MSHTDTMSARDAKNHFGELLDAARSAPVHITKNGRAVAVMLSLDEYRRFEAAEDAVWTARAQVALKKPEFIGARKSAALMKQLLAHNART